MSKAKSGDTVKVHYTGTLQNGAQFDSSAEREPLQFTLGEKKVIPGFEDAVLGMSVGDTKTVTIPAAKAYGPRNEEAVQEFPRSALPEHLELSIGLRLQTETPDGRPTLLTVTELTEDTVTFDANHPLAGEDLTFKLELAEIA